MMRVHGLQDPETRLYPFCMPGLSNLRRLSLLAQFCPHPLQIACPDLSGLSALTALESLNAEGLPDVLTAPNREGLPPSLKSLRICGYCDLQGSESSPAAGASQPTDLPERSPLEKQAFGISDQLTRFPELKCVEIMAGVEIMAVIDRGFHKRVWEAFDVGVTEAVLSLPLGLGLRIELLDEDSPGWGDPGAVERGDTYRILTF